MSPAAPAPGGRKPSRAGGVKTASVVVAWLALPCALGLIQQQLGWPYLMAFYALGLLAAAVIRVRQIHRRGETVADAIAAALIEQQLRRARRETARQHAAALPWLDDRRLSPADHPGVLITPSPDAPAYFAHGYDVVLDSIGDRKIQVISIVRMLTRISPKDAKDLLAAVPVTVLRVPDGLMADAARSLLELAGATTSITDPASNVRPAAVQDS